MRHALRRVLWVVPTLLATSVLLFLTLTSAAATAPGARLPRFFNPSPNDVRSLATRATAHLAAGDAASADAARELVRLGGAALPHVLPRLDAMSPAGRARVAQALTPLAERMGVASAEELASPDAAVMFWLRFWRERAIDFRPQVAQRLIGRTATRASSLRRADVQGLDTFALPDIMKTLGVARTAEDVARIYRLTRLAAHITGNEWRVPADATPAEANRVVTRWRRWWGENQAAYVTFDGPARLGAMVTETRYGHWAREAAGDRLGVLGDGRRVLDVLRAQAPVTLWLFAVGLLGGYLCGAVWGALGAAFAGSRLEAASSVLAVSLVALPVSVLAPWLGPADASLGDRLGAALLMLLGSAALVSRHQRAAARSLATGDAARTERAFGASRTRVALRGLRGSCAATLSLAAVDAPVMVTMAFVVERGFHLGGLGAVTVEALRAHDIGWLMTLGLLGVVGVALLQIATDLALAALDPRVRAGARRARGAFDG
ncbi:MAG: ABC transporter permease subunit [Sorangiineae bacterium]|nr:ABC transporter permease subunit [Polyangiaceae bacterium]MEB2321608.1 ABC transporter permease subunit [Sorangiineae bacterium]